MNATQTSPKPRLCVHVIGTDNRGNLTYKNVFPKLWASALERLPALVKAEHPATVRVVLDVAL